MSTTFYNTFSITISYGKNFGVSIYTGKPNQFPMAPPAGSDSGLRPPQGQSRRRKPIWLSSYITYSKGAKTLAPFEYNMERTECVPKGDFGFLKFGCLQLKVRDEKNLPVLKTTSGSALAQ